MYVAFRVPRACLYVVGRDLVGKPMYLNDWAERDIGGMATTRGVTDWLDAVKMLVGFGCFFWTSIYLTRS